MAKEGSATSTEKPGAEAKPDPKKANAKERSPNHPRYSLVDAIEMVRKLYDREKRSSVPSLVAVRSFGYGALSGTARAALAALRQYGLVEGGDNGLKVSDLSMTLLFGVAGSDEYKEALWKAARRPPLFAEMAATHADASDENLRSHLITKRGFSAEGASRFAATFRDAMKVEDPAGGGYTGVDQGGGGGAGSAGKGGAQAKDAPAREQQRDRADASNPGAFMEFTWPLSGDAVATLTVTRKIEADDIDTLSSYFEIAKRALQKAARTQLTTAPNPNAETASPQEE